MLLQERGAQIGCCATERMVGALYMLTEGDRAERLNVELIVEDRANLQMH